MNPFSDPRYLRMAQYKDSGNLGARAALHQRFSTNPRGWPRWAFEALLPYLRGQVLEVGGGPGWLWRQNADRLPPGVRVCFSDLSAGMAREARSALPAAGFAFLNLDVQALPFPDGTFSTVIANHMLYHVPDLPRAVRELARVIAPGGVLFAATNGASHLRELDELIHAFEPGFHDSFGALISTFSLENAAAVLASGFAHVELHRYPDALWVTEAQPLTDYMLSLTGDDPRLTPARAAEATRFFQARLDAAGGGLPITKDSGYALARQAP
jgi:ubiquinone/menaquinone biosynthesis C-methylase UbiE